MKQNGFSLIELVLVGPLFGLMVIGLIGWIINISRLATDDFCWCLMPIARIIGIVLPVVGAILGYIPS